MLHILKISFCRSKATGKTEHHPSSLRPGGKLDGLEVFLCTKCLQSHDTPASVSDKH